MLFELFICCVVNWLSGLSVTCFAWFIGYVVDWLAGFRDLLVARFIGCLVYSTSLLRLDV